MSRHSSFEQLNADTNAFSPCEHTFQVKPCSKPHMAMYMPIEESRKSLGPAAPITQTFFAGISALFLGNNTVLIAIAIHDGIYLNDYSVKTLDLGLPLNCSMQPDIIACYVLSELRFFEKRNNCKVLWAELDILPIELNPVEPHSGKHAECRGFWKLKNVDEQADSLARKCLLFFGPRMSPILQVGLRGLVDVDCNSKARMCALEDYKNSTSEPTWKATMKFAAELRAKGTKIAFFSSTPQGGGVALMRHALVRFSKLAGVDVTWYVPKPKPGIFQITKSIHNILQGVAKPDEFISAESRVALTTWIHDNAHRYWTSPGGPLKPSVEGGATIVVDDPQMQGLIPLSKLMDPKRPVIYRSHIQICAELIEKDDSPQADVWRFLWDNIQHADMFVSHPIPDFVPSNVPVSKIAYLGACTDWLDGLNKHLNEWDTRYFLGLYNTKCLATAMTPLNEPPGKYSEVGGGVSLSDQGKYFIQIARFDPSKGILDLVNSYIEFHRLLLLQKDPARDSIVPKLLIVGNGSVDDPDGSIIYEQVMQYIAARCSHIASYMSVMRLEPNDQLLNALISNAFVVLQLSTKEGFEIKVSEALFKGRPVIATKVGGIPLQIQSGKNGFLVDAGDWKSVALHLMNLWQDEELWNRMSNYARNNLSDDVSTVGNALAWFYLASRWNGRDITQSRAFRINDSARAAAHKPYFEEEIRIL